MHQSKQSDNFLYNWLNVKHKDSFKLANRTTFSRLKEIITGNEINHSLNFSTSLPALGCSSPAPLPCDLSDCAACVCVCSGKDVCVYLGEEGVGNEEALCLFVMTAWL